MALAAAATLAIMAFYGVRMLVPLPLFAADAGPYLVHAIYPDAMAVRDPYLTDITNGVHLSLIRAAWRIGRATGAPFVVIDNALDGALYIAGLVGLWLVSVRGLPRREQALLLILALGFAYYRFPFSNLAEGPFVATLAVVCLVTRAWWRSHPLLHAAAAGVACAALVLTKPHGVATVAALAAVAGIDAALTRDWRRLAARVALFALAFEGAGNLIQWAAQEPVANPALFFMSNFYSGAVGQAGPKDGVLIGLQALAIMGFASVLMAGAPIVLGLGDLLQRWRVAGHAMRLRGGDVVFVMLLASLAATLVMAAIFAIKVSGTPSETYRLWGRYFEFFVPMLWLAAAPAVARPASRGLALACGAATFACLAGLLAFLQRGWIVLPWDSAVLTAFFASDPVRALLPLPLPLRGLAAMASLAAAAAFALRVRPAVVGCAFLLALSGLSTWLDQVWLGDMARHRAALERDLRAIGPALPRSPAPVVLITPDINVGHLGFLVLKTRPTVVAADPQAPPPGALDVAAAVVATGDRAPPGDWSAVYRGPELSLWRPAAGALPSGR